MPTDPTPSTRPRTRRALLVGALGGAGALAASAVSRSAPVRATQGEAVLAGVSNTATATTTITNTVEDVGEAGLEVTAAEFGIHGHSLHDVGVWGTGAEQYGVLGLGPHAGVYGVSNTSSTSRGVYGQTESGDGVGGWSRTGLGVHAMTESGYALRADGRLKFSTSGVATINAGSTSKTVTPGVDVTSGSFVLLTPKTNIGSRALWFTTHQTGNKFTIRMSSSRSSNTPVAWLLLG